MGSASVERLRIAIDGPAGAGKSTVAKEIARRLGILYVDTGAMYRAVAWLAFHHRVAPTDLPAIMKLLENNPVRFDRGKDGAMDVYFGHRRITDELRTPEISETVSELSVFPDIRRVLTGWQRAFGAKHSVVMDGRDIGTVVLPDAELKVFLTADLRERAERRATEFQNQGITMTTEELAFAIEARDTRDANRTIAPLREAPDAHRIDSTGLSVEEVVDKILQLVQWEA